MPAPNMVAADAALNNVNKKVLLKTCTSINHYISKRNNTEVDNAKYIDVVMPMSNIIEDSDNYFKASWSLQQYHRDELALNTAGSIIDIFDDNNSALFKFKQKTGNEWTKDV